MDYGFDLDAVNGWEGKSDVVVQLEHTLYMTPF